MASWEGEYARSLTPEDVARRFQRAQMEADEAKKRQAMAAGLIATVTRQCPQCGTVLYMPADAVEAICGNCTACIARDTYGGWWVKG